MRETFVLLARINESQRHVVMANLIMAHQGVCHVRLAQNGAYNDDEGVSTYKLDVLTCDDQAKCGMGHGAKEIAATALRP